MTPNLSPTFNDFLFATVCEERNDMPLKVVSALARLDLDPWTEAASLARMPAEGAALRLSSLLAEVIDGPTVETNRATLSDRLVALLPMSESPTAKARAVTAAGRLVAPSRRVEAMVLLLLASMAASVIVGHLAPGVSRAGASPAPPHLASERHLSPKPIG